MAHAMDRADLVVRLLEAAQRLDGDAPELANAVRAAARVLKSSG